MIDYTFTRFLPEDGIITWRWSKQTIEYGIIFPTTWDPTDKEEVEEKIPYCFADNGCYVFSRGVDSVINIIYPISEFSPCTDLHLIDLYCPLLSPYVLSSNSSGISLRFVHLTRIPAPARYYLPRIKVK